MTLLIGLLIGLVLGLTGAGGSVFAVPLLVLLLGLPTGEAAGTALGAVAASAALGTLGRWRRGEIVWLPGLVLAATGALLAPVGRWLAGLVPETALLLAFAALAVAVAVSLWRKAADPVSAREVRASHAVHSERSDPLCRFNPSGQFELRPRCLAGVIAGGVVVGLLSGLFGVGGGFIIVPLLVLLLALPMHQAVATSLLIITLVSSAGFGAYLWLTPALSWATLGWLAAGGTGGMALGTLVSDKLAGSTLQRLFAVAVVLLVAAMVIHHLAVSPGLAAQ